MPDPWGFWLRLAHLGGAILLVGGGFWLAVLRGRMRRSGELDEDSLVAALRPAIDWGFRFALLLAVATGAGLLVWDAVRSPRLSDRFFRLLWWKVLLIGGLVVGRHLPWRRWLADDDDESVRLAWLRRIEAALWFAVAGLGAAMHGSM